MATKKSPPGKTRRRPPDPAGRRKYDPRFVACAVIAYRANDCQLAKTAAELGVPAGTLSQWVRGRRRLDLLTLRDATRDDMTAAFKDVLWASLTAALGKIDGANYSQLMIGAGVAFEKMRTLQGQSTIITEQRTVAVDVARLAERMSDEQLGHLVAALESAYGAADRPGGLADGGPGDSGAAALPAVSRPDVPGDGAEPDPTL
jgi:hypothetical protein